MKEQKMITIRNHNNTCTSTKTDTEGSTLANSSMVKIEEVKGKPLPPYCSGISTPIMPKKEEGELMAVSCVLLIRTLYQTALLGFIEGEVANPIKVPCSKHSFTKSLSSSLFSSMLLLSVNRQQRMEERERRGGAL